jgi:calcineurin-like phosphoesterase family protein
MLSWNKSFHGSFQLHGHIHSNQPSDGTCRRYDAGVDANNYFPVSWEEIKKTLEAINPRDGSEERTNRKS